MRLFPPEQYRGLHPAFPAWTEDSVSARSGSLHYMPFCGLAALPIGGVLASLRRPQPWATATKVAAYAFVGMTAAYGLGRSMIEVRARTFLHAQGIAVPNAIIWDRVGQFDFDDAIVSGGLLGMLMAALPRSRRSVFGWKRYLGAFALGTAPTMLIFPVYLLSQQPIEQLKRANKRDEELRQEAARWQVVVNSEFRKAAASISQPATIPPNSDKGNPNLPRTPLGGSTPGGSAQSPVNGPGMGLLQDPNEPEMGEDGPHVTLRHPGDPEPIPKPQTNYRWTSDNEIEDLEKHISKLQERRQRLARESEFVWAWLAEKEAEYYNSPESKKAAGDKTAKSDTVAYLQLLSTSHVSTWTEVSQLDWMIADARKRIEQRRSAQSSDEGIVTWRAKCSEAAAKPEPLFALQGLRDFMQQLDQAKQQLQQVKEQTALEMADPEFDLKENVQVFDPIKKKVVNEKEAFLEARKGLDEHVEAITKLCKAIDEMVAEGKKRAKEITKG